MIKDDFVFGDLVSLKNETKISDEIVFIRCLSNEALTTLDLIRLKIEQKKYEFNKYNINKNKSKVFNNRLVLYEYVHFNLNLKKNIHYDRSKEDGSSKLNVVFLVLDGVSLSSMKRALPKTLKFLNRSNDFFLFEKHHVIGSNTFENLVPMLTNMDASTILGKSDSKLHFKKPFDEYPFIWKNFSERCVDRRFF